MLTVLGVSAGPLEPGSLDFANGISSIMEIIKENKPNSDKQIKKATSDNTDASGKQIKTHSETYEQTETDSIIVTYTILVDTEKGNTYQDAKVHKNTNMGRNISAPYK